MVRRYKEITVDSLKPELCDAWGNILGNNRRVLFTVALPTRVPHSHNAGIAKHPDGFVLQALDKETPAVRGDSHDIFIRTQAVVNESSHEASRIQPDKPTVYYLMNGHDQFGGDHQYFNALTLPILHLWQAVTKGGKVIFYPQEGASKTLQLTADRHQFPDSFQQGMDQLELLLSKFDPNLSYRKLEHFD